MKMFIFSLLALLVFGSRGMYLLGSGNDPNGAAVFYLCAAAFAVVGVVGSYFERHRPTTNSER